MDTLNLKEVDFPSQKRKLSLHTGLDADARDKVAEGLKSNLADSYLLLLKTHYYHWNVKGTLFKSLHDMTEEQYTELFEAIDDLAERLRALGHEAPGTFSEYAKLSHVRDAKKGLTDLEMAADLLETQENVITKMRSTLETASEAKDEVTVDMMVGRLTIHEKNAWMLRSFIEQ
jgi:starvation-inducible DNA-binding protein